MNDEEKVLRMHDELHGKPSGRCSREVEWDECNDNIIGLSLTKDGRGYGFIPIANLVFDYLTKDWKLK